MTIWKLSHLSVEARLWDVVILGTWNERLRTGMIEHVRGFT